MTHGQPLAARRRATFMAMASVVLVSHLTAHTWAAEPEEEKPAVIGRIDFDDASLPPANVEIDLGEGMVSDLFGIGDAALEGVVEALSQSSGQHPEATRMAAEQLQAARQILDLAGDAVQEVRVRAYEELPEGAVAYFDAKLKEGQWETLVRARNGDENVRVALVRDKGAVNGVFVIASDGSGLVVVNAVCDISPENIKKLTSAATRIGLENGLAEAIQQQMQHMHHRLPPPNAPTPPAPPSPPSEPKK